MFHHFGEFDGFDIRGLFDWLQDNAVFCSTVVLVLLEDGDGSICGYLHSRFAFHFSVEAAAIRRRTIFVYVLSGVLKAAEVLRGAIGAHCRVLTNRIINKGSSK